MAVSDVNWKQLKNRPLTVLPRSLKIFGAPMIGFVRDFALFRGGKAVMKKLSAQTRLLSLLGLFVFLWSTAQAQITPVGDTYTNTADPTSNYGAQTLLDCQWRWTRAKGDYIHPELYGAPAEKQIEWRHPEQITKRMREHRQQMKEKQAQLSQSATLCPSITK
jgi:hypothetical protein